LRTDLTGTPFRFWPVRPYLIVYKAESRPVEILAVLHGHRHVARILGERVDR
jgi:antitoxin ParD1/3/4/toxin ParE1/3/4